MGASGRVIHHVIVDNATVTVAGHVVPDRPSSGAGRVFRTAALSMVTTGQAIYTVTVGKTLYVSDFMLSVNNTSTTALADIRITDGSGGTVILNYLAEKAGTGALAAAEGLTTVPAVFPEPRRFSTSVWLTITSGTVTVSASFAGYEE